VATLTYQQIKITGTDVDYDPADAAGDKFFPSPRGFLVVRNASASSITVTVDDPNLTEFGQATANPSIVVAASTNTWIGPFPQHLAGSDGLVSVSYSSATSVTVAVGHL
jgi:hypothetical protein